MCLNFGVDSVFALDVTELCPLSVCFILWPLEGIRSTTPTVTFDWVLNSQLCSEITCSVKFLHVGFVHFYICIEFMFTNIVIYNRIWVASSFSLIYKQHLKQVKPLCVIHSCFLRRYAFVTELNLNVRLKLKIRFSIIWFWLELHHHIHTHFSIHSYVCAALSSITLSPIYQLLSLWKKKSRHTLAATFDKNAFQLFFII